MALRLRARRRCHICGVGRSLRRWMARGRVAAVRAVGVGSRWRRRMWRRRSRVAAGQRAGARPEGAAAVEAVQSGAVAAAAAARPHVAAVRREARDVEVAAPFRPAAPWAFPHDPLPLVAPRPSAPFARAMGRSSVASLSMWSWQATTILISCALDPGKFSSHSRGADGERSRRTLSMNK